MGIVVVGTTVAQAQGAWSGFCADFGVPGTPVDPYSAPFIPLNITTDLFGATIGITGTVAYKFCPPIAGGGTWSHDITGGLGFSIGVTGSVQDDLVGAPVDNLLMLTMGMNDAPGGNYSYVMTERRAQDGTTPTRTRFGANGIDTFFRGLSDKYLIAETTNDEIRVQLRVDMLGDAARCQWRMTNTNATTAYRVGLSYGAAVGFLGRQVPPGGFDNNSFNTVAGRRPIVLDTRFRRVSPDVSSTTFPEFAMPKNVNFGVTQSRAYGLQVVLDPTSPGSGAVDQTPVDVLTIGKAGFLLGSQVANTGTLPAAVLPDTAIFDGPFNSCAFVQVWEPTAVTSSAGGASATRQIIAYYRSTTGVSDYDAPYNVVVDGVKVIGTGTDINTFTPNPSTIRVYIDNTRGFSTVQQEIPLNDVKITLSLPNGLSDATAPGRTVITKFIPSVLAKETRFVDFQFTTDANVSGVQPYTVKIEPNPGPVKTIQGSVNVATLPRLTLAASTTGTANLVGVPWNFEDTSWGTILGGIPDVDFQVFTWEPTQQSYILQTSPQRGRGSFVIMKGADGSRQLGGNPSIPPDLATGAPLTRIKGGPGGSWNLIANPYHFSFPLGQILGVNAGDPKKAYTFQELVTQGVISGAIASWDPLTQRYVYSNNLTDPVEPNKGYWIFVSSSSDVTLSFPPIFEPFIPLGTGGIKSSGTDWRLQLVTTNTKTGIVDNQTYLGFSKKNDVIKSGRLQKAPIAPTANALHTAIIDGTGAMNNLSQLVTGKVGTTNVELKVTSKAAGPVRVTWPNFSAVPKNVKIQLTEVGTNRVIDMRSTTGYTFNATANSAKSFRLIVVTQ